LLHKIKRKKTNWIGHIWRRYCLVKCVTEGKIEGRIEVLKRGRKSCKQLLDDLKEMSGYCKLKDEALDRSLLGARCGRRHGPVVRQAMELRNALSVLM